MIAASHARRGRRLSASLIAGLAALTLGHAVHAQEVPFTGVVVDDEVEVRAGPGRAYYVVDVLERGDQVRVEQVLFGWNKIVAPESSHSFIQQAFVNARGDGSVGVVSADRKEVKAGAMEGPPGASYKTQVVLNEGDRVAILGEAGDWYRIRPPRGAHVYLPPGSVRRANQLALVAEEAEREMDEPRQPEQPAEAERDEGEAASTAAEADPREAEPSQQAVTSDPPATVEDRADELQDVAEGEAGPEGEASQPDVPTMTMDSNQAEAGGEGASDAEPMMEIAKGQEMATETETAALAELEARAVPALKKPVEAQPIERLRADYRALLENPEVELTSSERQLVRMRLAVLERNAQLREALAKIEETRRQLTEAEAGDGAAAPTGDAVAPRPPSTAADYDAVGRLMASSVYDGRSLPRMFRLVDPTARRTLAYLAPADVEPSAMLGRIVGVVGESQYDPSLKLRIFEVESIDVLDGGS